MKRIAALLLALTVVLAGCGPTVLSGTVIDKQFTPAHTNTYDVMVGKILVPEVENVADDWQVEIRDADGKTGWLDVTRGTYLRLHAGDYYARS